MKRTRMIVYSLCALLCAAAVLPALGGCAKMNEGRQIIVSDIGRLRDPSVIKTSSKYYVYGTGWQGFYSESKDLSGSWQPLGEVVEVPEDSDGDHWAPEVHEYRGEYYMFTTYKSKITGRRGCAIFKASKPEGPFKMWSDGAVTPKEWDSIDGTLYVDETGQPWMVFVHEWVSTDDGIGRMAYAKMSKDLKNFISEPVEMFRADDAPWCKGVVTDGCWMYVTNNGKLLMLWSSFNNDGYCVGVATSASGSIEGPWEHAEKPLFSKSVTGEYDGGHCMIFKDFDGKLWMSLHSPNSRSDGKDETPVFVPIKEEKGKLLLDIAKNN